MDSSPSLLAEQLDALEQDACADIGSTAERIAEVDWSAESWRRFFEQMTERPPLRSPACRKMLGWIVSRATEQLCEATSEVAWEEAAARFYRHDGARDSASLQCLLMLFRSPNARAEALFLEGLLGAPPDDPMLLEALFRPLFQEPIRARELFPELLQALQHPSLAAPVLDLANFLHRELPDRPHPAQPHAGELVRLLGELAHRLGQFEEGPTADEDQFLDVSRQVAHAASLVVALCDSVALMELRDAIPKLYQVLDVRHRRIQVEAAAALARLGEAYGTKQLVRLAAEPVVRLHVLKYAEESGCLEEIPEPYLSAYALAEARLALALAQPDQVGVPPGEMELVDQRRLFWPGFADRVDCCLIRFSYTSDDGMWSNIALVGPSVRFCEADLADLAPDDIFAYYAGIDTEHDEIVHWRPEEWTADHRTEIARWTRRLQDSGYESIHPLLLGRFFGDWSLVAKVERQGTQGLAVIDAGGVWSVPCCGKRPLGSAEVYAIYKGRKLLRVFNQEDEK